MYGGLFTMFLPCFSAAHASHICTSFDTDLLRICVHEKWRSICGVFPYVCWKIRCFFAYFLTP